MQMARMRDLQKEQMLGLLMGFQKEQTWVMQTGYQMAPAMDLPMAEMSGLLSGLLMVLWLDLQMASMSATSSDLQMASMSVTSLDLQMDHVLAPRMGSKKVPVLVLPLEV
jgi:hypothetical protein